MKEEFIGVFEQLSLVLYKCQKCNLQEGMDICIKISNVKKEVMLLTINMTNKSSNPTKILFYEKVPATVSCGSSISKPGKLHCSSEMQLDRYQEGVQVHNGYCNETPQVFHWLLVGHFSKQFEQCL